LNGFPTVSEDEAVGLCTIAALAATGVKLEYENKGSSDLNTVAV
jgi:hypothetical protein